MGKCSNVEGEIATYMQWISGDTLIDLCMVSMVCSYFQTVDYNKILFPPVNCDALVPPINSSITYSNNSILDYGGFSIGANATYSCTTGQLFIGDTTRTCLHTGEWGGEEPQCLGKYIAMFTVFTTSYT